MIIKIPKDDHKEEEILTNKNKSTQMKSSSVKRDSDLTEEIGSDR